MKIFDVMRDPTNQPDFSSSEFVKREYFGVVNVSDSPCMTFEFQDAGIKSLWFPIHEIGYWSYAPFFGVAKFLDQKLSAGDARPILLHCHAGVNRSACVAYANLNALGLSQSDIDKKMHISDGFPTLFQSNIERGYIPSDTIALLQARRKYPTYSLHGLLNVIDSPNQYLKRASPIPIKFNGIDI